MPGETVLVSQTGAVKITLSVAFHWEGQGQALSGSARMAGVLK